MCQTRHQQQRKEQIDSFIIIIINLIVNLMNEYNTIIILGNFSQ